MGDTNGIVFTDLLGASKPLTKFIETVSAGIGKIYEPTHKKRMAKADKQVIKMLSEEITGNLNLPITYDDGKIIIDTQNTNDLLLRTQQRLINKEMKIQENIETVVDIAYNEMSQQESVSDQPVDTDWITRFFNVVGEVNNQDMQYIWAKILSGEISQPGSFSLRTLETIRNLSQYEAQIFQKITPLILKSTGKAFLSADEGLLRKYDVKYADIMTLNECGLINSFSSIFLNIVLKAKRERCYVNTQELIRIKNSDQETQKLSIKVHSLTKAGIELFKILNTDFTSSYLLDFAELIRTENDDANVEISVHKVNFIDDDTIDFEDEAIKVFKKEA